MENNIKNINKMQVLFINIINLFIFSDSYVIMATNKKMGDIMPRELKVTVSLSKNNEKIMENVNIDGFFDNKCVKYQEEDGALVVVSVNENSLSIKRETNDSNMILLFEEGKILDGEYQIIDLNSNMPLTTETNMIIKKEDSLFIAYDLRSNNEMLGSFEYYLEYKR